MKSVRYPQALEVAAQTAWHSNRQRRDALQALGSTCDSIQLDTGHIRGRQTQTENELALVAGGDFQVEEDLEAEADCRQAKASSRRKPGSGGQRQRAIIRTAVSTGSMKCSDESRRQHATSNIRQSVGSK